MRTEDRNRIGREGEETNKPEVLEVITNYYGDLRSERVFRDPVQCGLREERGVLFVQHALHALDAIDNSKNE